MNQVRGGIKSKIYQRYRNTVDGVFVYSPCLMMEDGFEVVVKNKFIKDHGFLIANQFLNMLILSISSEDFLYFSYLLISYSGQINSGSYLKILDFVNALEGKLYNKFLFSRLRDNVSFFNCKVSLLIGFSYE